MSCYCQERKTNPLVAEQLRDIPPGYCGLCDLCGQPGHTRAHPRLPTTGSWCDEHWQELLTSKKPGLDRLLQALLLFIGLVVMGYILIRQLF